MNIELIQGSFSKSESLDLITQMIHVKIKFHENKVKQSSNEEDIKMREKRIKQLQKDLYDLRKTFEKMGNSISLTSNIVVT